MSGDVPRMRMFAGPNGSGKTTIKEDLGRNDDWFGIYINPDDLEATIRRTGEFSVASLGLGCEAHEPREFFASSQLLREKQLHETASAIDCRSGVVDFRGIEANSYYASVLADFLRRKALAEAKSFSFETVMSAADKVELLRAAQQAGFRTYLYYVATEDATINVARVKYRVESGGHDVSEHKIIDRYRRSLELLGDAIRHSNRAFLFDTSEADPWFFAEAENGIVHLRSDEMPNWFRPVWDKL